MRERRRFASAAARLAIASALLRELRESGLGWLTPFIVALLLLAILIAAIHVSRTIVPFLYPLL